jgi:hypothetical protein
MGRKIEQIIIDAQPQPQEQAKDPLPATYDMDALKAQQQAYEEQSNAYVITHEWDQHLETGDPFEDAAKRFKDANPHLEFRFLSDRVNAKRGKRGYVEVEDPQTGKSVVVGGLTLAAIPKDIFKARSEAKYKEATQNIDASSDRLKEQERRAVHDSKGAIEILPDEDMTHEGRRRIRRAA